MKTKKRIAFMAPKTKGGPYHIHKELVEGLNSKYGNNIKVTLYNSNKAWFKLHFTKKYDTIVSVIPFLFKPLGTNKYIYNLHGNFELEKKKNSLGNKLLYFAKNNLEFSDKIWLVSYFLADKLDFRRKYDKKIEIIPNFIDIENYNFGEKKYDNTKYKILTITSFKFYEKGRGIIDLGKVIAGLGQKTTKKIERTIVGNSNNDNFRKIKTEFDKISFGENISIIWKGRLSKKELNNQLKDNDYFLYWTYLDNFPGVILEAIASKMKVFVNNFESFKYFLNSDIICNGREIMIEKVLQSKGNRLNIKDYDIDMILNKISIEL